LQPHNGWWRLSFRNYNLNEMTVKALACLIPFLVHVEEVEFTSNTMDDMVGSCIAFAVFMNPTIKGLIVNGNNMGRCYFLTLAALCKRQN
jgi:hypothetical protein